MPGEALQQLLWSGEYEEFEDIVITEAEFIEFDYNQCAVRQVILGISPYNFIKASRHILDYKRNPEVYYNTEADPYIDGLEIASIVPLCLLSVKFSYVQYELVVTTQRGIRSYLLCNTHYNGQLEDTWYSWVERVEYIHTDPYHYIRDMLDEHGLRYSSEYMEIENATSRIKALTGVHQESVETENEGFVDTIVGGKEAHTNEGRYIIQGGTKKIIGIKDRKKRQRKKTFSWKFLCIKRKKK